MRKISDNYLLPEQTDKSLLETLLINRNINPVNKDIFLHPKWEDNHDPMLMHNMRSVVGRVWTAITNNESVVIFSDFDADGVPGAVILSDFFKKIEFTNYTVHIPNRNKDGFGLNPTACQQFIDDKTDLLITIDCGIANLECIAQLQTGGVDVVVTDHHLPSSDGLPDCLILDPKQPDCQYPFSELCGSGVIFKLVQAMLANQPDGYDIDERWSRWLLDMVGIATICDMVPLVGENRIFAHYGLQVLRKSPRTGLQALLKLARINQSQIVTQDLGFGIGPRINAASRLGDPMTAFRALSTNGSDGEQAATELEQLNKRRKTTVAQAVKKAYKKVDATDTSDVLVVGDTDWPLGIVGLIAGNLADKYQKPAFVWTRVDDLYKGSVRSGGTCSINQLMSTADQDTFVSFGGHAAAGGFVCDDGQIHKLHDNLQDAWCNCESYTPDKKQLDAHMTPDDVTKDNWDVINTMEPYGIDNPAPIFYMKDTALSGVRTFGKENNHLSLSFKNSRGWNINAIRFNHASIIETIPKIGDTVTLVVSMEMNTYNGSSELRLRIEEIEL